MATWIEVSDAAPELAGRVQDLFTKRKHHTMATIRSDGSPRISGTEVQFAEGELRFGMMSGVRRGWDLRRDPRPGIYSQGSDPPEENPDGWPGEAKIAGTAIEVAPGEIPGGEFVVEVSDVVLTYLDGELVIEHWRPDRGVVRYRR